LVSHGSLDLGFRSPGRIRITHGKGGKTASCRSRRPSAKPSPCTSTTGTTPAAHTCSSPPGRSPTPPAASRTAHPVRRRRSGAQHAPAPAAALPVHLAQDPRLDDALIQPYSGHASRQSLEVYSRLALTDAQAGHDHVIGRFPV